MLGTEHGQPSYVKQGLRWEHSRYLERTKPR